MRASVLPVIFSLALTLASSVILAQTGDQRASDIKTVSETPPSLFSRLFQRPANNNGYEEWVQAADLIRNNPTVDAVTTPSASLASMRHLLAEPSVRQALLLMRQGLEKPIRSPRQYVDETTLFPELMLFRQLARLLSLQMHVDFVDGRMDAAVADLRTGLGFGYYIQTDTLISGLVGIAIDAIVLDAFAPHIDRLSANQCSQVVQFVQEGLHSECPAGRLLTLERSYERRSLEARRSNADGMLALLDAVTGGEGSGTGGNPEETAALQSLQDRLIDHPQDLNAIIDEAEARIDALYNQAMLDLQLPITQRKPLLRDKTSSPGYWLFRTITPSLQPVLDKYDTAQEKLRLLGVHALIHRYRLMYKALPNTLAELRAADLVKDPFTGAPIVYQHHGGRYTLYSQGPLKLDENGQAISKERTQVKLKNLPYYKEH